MVSSAQAATKLRRLSKAVYIDKRELKCVGGSSNMPLGFVSLTENLMMIWMAAVSFGLTGGHAM
ncbi:Hypothetical protein NGAL_HAMBI1189_40760 [Neorhizobium galegae bv. officinalis]|uniref:Uncharacterized protein n=1 Tax=Neorhizobium galegae bv. officinalis TaxID=323656 RepID=A0A0T7GWV4_NEOGA|nr:Hypothetical protein NGAL_HAMBI1189_40760 [Neorhizobium galegae bv. officinalis]